MARIKDTYSIEFEVKEALASVNKLKNVVNGFIAVLAIDKVVEFGQAIIESSKKFETYRNQLTLVTKNSQDLDRVFNLLTETAIKNRTSFESTIDLFTKLRISTEALGISEQRVIDVTSKLSQALQVAGADTATTNSVVRQFGQAMASGTVRGDEFNSLVEGLGPALAIMARESGITVGQLRNMSQAGELTAETMFKLLENSRSLTAAFNSMETTTGQLETRLSDAFDRAAVEVGKTLKITQTYNQILREITRFLDRIAGTENALVNLSTDKIFEGVRSSTIDASEAFQELESRINHLRTQARGAGVFANIEEIKQIEQLQVFIKAIIDLQKQRSDITKKQLEEETNLQKNINAILQKNGFSISDINNLNKEMAKIDFSSPYEKAKNKLLETQQQLQKLITLQQALEKAKLPTDSYVNLNETIKLTETAVKKLQDQVTKLTQLEGFDKFYTELVQAANDSVEQFNFATDAASRLIQELLDGKISADAFAYAMESVNKILEKTTEETENITSMIQDYQQGLEDSSQQLQQQLDQLNLNKLDSELQQIENKLKQNLTRQIRELQAQLKENPQQADRIQQEIQRITKLTDDAIAAQQELVRKSYEEQNSFVNGWKTAMRDYVEEVKNGAMAAQRIFSNTTKGMEDMIVNFAKTGKFEFKSFINSILEDLLRSQVRQLIAQVFGFGGKSGGGFVSDFGKLLGFANGGIIPTNSPVLVGERGPEIISGAAGRMVTPNNQLGGGQVTYNINAVDAASFRELVARDPQFIYAVTEQGRRSIPQTRR